MIKYFKYRIDRIQNEEYNLPYPHVPNRIYRYNTDFYDEQSNRYGEFIFWDKADVFLHESYNWRILSVETIIEEIDETEFNRLMLIKKLTL